MTEKMNPLGELTNAVHALMTEVRRLRVENALAKELLRKAGELCDDNADVVDGPDGQPYPDRFMRMGRAIQEFLERAR